MKFKDWFDKKLIVGSFPIMNNSTFEKNDYDVIINVSDEYYRKYHFQNSFWFPMGEVKRDVGLNSMYGAMCILFEAEKNNKSVYLHCHAGVNRSRSVQSAYYFMRTGEHLESDRRDYGFINRLVAMCGRGYLPPKAEMESFLTKLGLMLNGTCQENELMGGQLDSIKLDSIKNF